MSVCLSTPPSIQLGKFPAVYFNTLVTAIFSAWEALRASDFDNFSDEDQTTDQLEYFLIKILECEESNLPLFSSKYFETPCRDAKQRNHDGSKIDKMPDLTFRLNGYIGLPIDSRTIFVECKVIDGSRNVNLYCKHGILRFVAGEYAHHMGIAMMIAYVIDNTATLPAAIDSYFSGKLAPCAEVCKPISTVVPAGSAGIMNTTCTTKHTRIFKTAPGPIDLFHIWLPAF